MNLGSFSSALKSGQFITISECKPPRGADSEPLKSCAGALGSFVHAICASESEDGARMCSIAACSHLIAAGVDPVLHVLTRDLNRIALQSTILGAASIGVKNILCLGGRHQALTSSSSARGVYDVDPVQLLRIADGLRKSGKTADGEVITAPIELNLGTDTNPFSDPIELQVIALENALNAGADFVITTPVFNIDKFNTWMNLIREKNLHTRTAIIASVMLLTSKQEAVDLAAKYTHLDISDENLNSLSADSDQRAAGVNQAVQTINALKSIDGVRGVSIVTGEDYLLAADVIKASGLSRS